MIKFLHTHCADPKHSTSSGYANNTFGQSDFGLSFDAASIQDQLNKGNEVIVDGASMESNGFKNIRIAKDNTVMFQLNDQALKDNQYQKELINQFRRKNENGLADYKYNCIVKKDKNGRSKKIITEIGHKHIHASNVKKDENNNFHLSYSI